jgi:hypothetical protein
MFIKKAALVLAGLALVQMSYASEHVKRKKEQSVEKVERVEVVGRKTKHLLFTEFKRFRSDYVNTFNDLVDERELRVVCKFHSYTGTHIRKENCVPKFFNTIRHRETQRAFFLSRLNGFGTAESAIYPSISGIADNSVVRVELLEEYERFEKVTVELLNANPELAQKWVEMEEALLRYRNHGKDV